MIQIRSLGQKSFLSGQTAILWSTCCSPIMHIESECLRARKAEEDRARKTKEDEKSGRGMQLQGYKVEGLTMAGHETCIIFPSLDLAFDIGLPFSSSL
ncbi:hypothetical protein WN943_004489 [Citrus x changshan-huyou]